jgi:hypothetical protein
VSSPLFLHYQYGFLSHFIYVFILLDILTIPCKYSTCFTHPSRSTNNISGLTYDKCCRLTSAIWFSQMTARRDLILSCTLNSPPLSQWLRLVFQCHGRAGNITQQRYLEMAGSMNLLIWGVAVVFLLYLTESVIGQSVSYYFLADMRGCDWRLKGSRGKCCTLGHF